MEGEQNDRKTWSKLNQWKCS